MANRLATDVCAITPSNSSNKHAKTISPLTRETFEVFSQHLATSAKRAPTGPPPLDTIDLQRALLNAASKLEENQAWYSHLLCRAARRLESAWVNPFEQVLFQMFIPLLSALVRDLRTLAFKCASWRRQYGISSLNATFRDQYREGWRNVPYNVVNTWLEQTSEVENQRLADSMWHVWHILILDINLNFADSFGIYFLAACNGQPAKPIVTTAPTRLVHLQGEVRRLRERHQ